MTQNYGKSSSPTMGLPDLQTNGYAVHITKRTTRLQKPRVTLNNTNKDGTMHPEYNNPPSLITPYTDEDYALVCNVWRRELGLEPLV